MELWQSILIYLVCSWNIAFLDICMTFLLLQYTGVERRIETQKGETLILPNNQCKQITSQVVDDIAQYSIFVKDLQTISCFLLFQK